MRFSLRRPTAVIFFVVALAVAAGVAGGTTLFHHSSKSSSPARYTATPDGEADSVGQLEKYWNDRITYPTGHFNPAWLRHAAAQADKIPSRMPKGTYADGSGAASVRSVGTASTEAPTSQITPNVPLNTPAHTVMITRFVTDGCVLTR